MVQSDYWSSIVIMRGGRRRRESSGVGQQQQHQLQRALPRTIHRHRALTARDERSAGGKRASHGRLPSTGGGQRMTLNNAQSATGQRSAHAEAQAQRCLAYASRRPQRSVPRQPTKHAVAPLSSLPAQGRTVLISFQGLELNLIDLCSDICLFSLIITSARGGHLTRMR